MAIDDVRMEKLVSLARQIESDLYEKAKTRSEYYHLLAKEIYKYRNLLDKMRQKRGERHQMQQSSSISNLDVADSEALQHLNQIMDTLSLE